MIRRRKPRKTGIDWAAIEAAGGLGKGRAAADTKAADDAHERAVQLDSKRELDIRQKGRCIAESVSPVCRKIIQHPHHLIRRSATRNWPAEMRHATRLQVGVCAPCHREADARVGGCRLLFDWPGKDWGAMPNADEQGNVRPIWRP